MKSVKLNRKDLLKIVIENRAKHISAYNESVEDYKVAAVKVAAKHVELANSGDLKEIAGIKAMPPAPVSYEKEYDRAIRMLELSVDKEIEVEEAVFNQLVLDEWHWKHQFVASSTLYKSL